jgi:hypothetical protein
LRTILRYKTFAAVALILWLLASWSGAHGHLCFDGQEPPLSLHMDMLSEHTEHHADEKHTDADVSPGQLALAKLLKLDLFFMVAAALLLAMVLASPSVFISRYFRRYSRRLIGLRPQLRAPPFFPA